MPCLRSKIEDILNVYDLKGFTEGRRLNLDEYENFKFGKDENFVESKDLDLILNLPEE